MKPTIHDVQKLAHEIQKASNCGNKIRLQQVLTEMISTCASIKNEMEEKKKLSEDININLINSLPFVYKPILRKNYYEGNYLEEFSVMRTSELKEGKALDVHNKFWQTHEILRGNVFGSLPKELINKESKSKLERYGWDEVIVDVYEVNDRTCNMRDLVDYCELRYTHFLIVKEKNTSSELILHYKV